MLSKRAIPRPEGCRIAFARIRFWACSWGIREAKGFTKAGGRGCRRAWRGKGAARAAGPNAGNAGELSAAGNRRQPTSRLRIAPVTVELTPNHIISTIGYNGTSPGPLLRMREGVPVTVDVINDTDVPEYVHLHGLFLPSEVDGAEEEGTPPVPPLGRRRYQFTPRPAGTRWYHSHAMADGRSASRHLHGPVRIPSD